MRHLLLSVALMTSVPLSAQVKTPDRPVTDPRSLNSPANPNARAVPLEDIGTSRGVQGAAWSADGSTSSCPPT
jgi:hypothetical protein